MKNYFVTVGMEVHAELKTKSKMWCDCANVPLEREINKHICSICTAQPGTLPVPNKEAIRKVITVGLACNSRIADFTEFDRKNYFYPDIPKGYQITQYLYPIVAGGALSGVPLTRIHQEEDTAKSDHESNIGTLIDFNRAGVPLMELVTEAVTYDSAEAAAKGSGDFCRDLQRLLRTLDASDANMEMGQMRCEANISITLDKNVFGTKCEVKNLNSFASVEKAIRYEVERHAEMLAEGKTIVQETRGWDENKNETFSQRKKENAHDYRYFPDPDLPKMYLHKLFDIEKMRAELPELPWDKKVRLATLGLQEKHIEMMIDDKELSDYFDSVCDIAGVAYTKNVANYLLTDASGLLSKGDEYKLPAPNNFATLIKMSADGDLSSRATKDILEVIMRKDQDPRAYAEANSLIQKTDTEALAKIVAKVISENTKEWEEYKGGAEKLQMFFVGKCMKEAAGSGNPQLFIELIKNATNN
jgi:aspartyl-tRNA(Asn)/glutamyl-tRNA(Gln) amidotransferase subunit B